MKALKVANQLSELMSPSKAMHKESHSSSQMDSDPDHDGDAGVHSLMPHLCPNCQKIAQSHLSGDSALPGKHQMNK